MISNINIPAKIVLNRELKSNVAFKSTKSSYDSVSFIKDVDKQPLMPVLKSFMSLSFLGNVLKSICDDKQNKLNSDIDRLEMVTPQSVNDLIKKHLSRPETIVVKDISDLPYQQKSAKVVIYERSKISENPEAIIYIDSKAPDEKLKPIIKEYLNSHFEDLEIQKTVSTFRDRLNALDAVDKHSVEKIIKDLGMSDIVNVLDSSTDEVSEYCKSVPALCLVPKEFDPENPKCDLCINFSINKMDMMHTVVHEFTHALQLQKKNNFFVYQKPVTREFQQKVNTACAKMDMFLQNVIAHDVNMFAVVDESKTKASKERYVLYKAAIGNQLSSFEFEEAPVFINRLYLWALQEAEAYKEGLKTIRDSKEFVSSVKRASINDSIDLTGDKIKFKHFGIDIVAKYYQDFANCIAEAIN